MTGGRLLSLVDNIDSDHFMLTYGDGLSDINISDLHSFHLSHSSQVTISAVRPRARFGLLNICDDNRVNQFIEKPEADAGWINGGYMVINRSFLDTISSSDTVLEKEPLEHAASKGNLMAFKHHGFWQCMDTLRDYKHLEEIHKSGKAPWIRSES